MPFQQLPILETMLQLYQQPRTFDRFQAYLTLLQGNKKGDLILPIGGFNPMAKEHVVKKIIELKQLNIEGVINETLQQLNAELNKENGPIIKVAFNLCDDLKGAWTNRFTTDYDSKFKLNALVERNFCTPIFWSSEKFSTELIIERTLEYCNRTLYWQKNKNPETLADHILQESTIAKKLKPETQAGIRLETIDQFFQLHKTSIDYNLIFNFFYGDAATILLGNNPLGIEEPFAGFKYANWLAQQTL